jgi:hypothetical protein
MADDYTAVTEGGESLEDPSADSLYMLISGLDQAGDRVVTVEPADCGGLVCRGFAA